MSRCDLLTLQGRAKRDPEGYRDDVLMQLQHYNALHGLFMLKPGKDFREFADLVGFLARTTPHLAPGGLLLVKESVARAGAGFYADRAEASITRTDEHFRELFARANLRVRACRMQPGLPRAIFPVCMYALEAT